MSELVASWPLLSIVTFLPAAGALLILLARVSRAARTPATTPAFALLTLIITIATFLVSLFAFAAFDSERAGLSSWSRDASLGVRRIVRHGRRLAWRCRSCC